METDKDMDKDMDNDNIMDLDTEWIEEFETLDEQYKMFYKENIVNIKCTYIYVNKSNDIDGSKEENIILKQHNRISREEMVELIKKNSYLIDTDKSYSVLSILKYNFDIEPSDISLYTKEKGSHMNEDYSFLKLIKNIDDIPLNQTIFMFHDLNEIIIIFYEKTSLYKKNNICLTKKIYIHNKKRKTHRKKT
jgi:hypothetical protein